MQAPEYGGDGKKVGDCAKYPAPVASFPAHWAPNDLLIYTGSQFGQKYSGGVFIAFHDVSRALYLQYRPGRTSDSHAQSCEPVGEMNAAGHLPARGR